MGDKTTISTLVEGGSASAGPPLGPELGPLPTDVGEVVKAINEKTADFQGMEVPVDVIVDEETGDFEIEVGKPPAAVLIKDELGIESGSGEPNKNKVADMEFATACKVARMKASDLLAMDLRGAVKEIIGTAHSMGVTIDGKDAYDVAQEIDEGKYDDKLEAEEGI
ncbi:50S ribosomal protein L11 [Candidatus Nanohalovita haloferacivicina]|uniref:50S ribosomal protein L11 n=1 Tax=Candidatus Nanohalovita haloferacivicina TaxID=2978046 RepID=UPI00325F975D|nr:Ribosomal protein L11 [Candidatus Nanohalobia archaeon BNXNv]